LYFTPGLQGVLFLDTLMFLLEPASAPVLKTACHLS